MERQWNKEKTDLMVCADYIRYQQTQVGKRGEQGWPEDMWCTLAAYVFVVV